MTQHILFEAAGLDLAVPSHRVSVIHEQLPVEKVSGTKQWFLGLAVSRGRLLPVSDLGAFVGRQPCQGRTLELDIDASLVALRVGDVSGVCDTEAVEDNKPADREVDAQNLSFTGKMVRIDGRMHRVLDIAALVQSAAFNQIKDTFS